ncbi:MAG: polyprenyl diphosphate synthase, partial [Bacteroidota bacterium]
SVRDTVKAAVEIGVSYLTFFAFSTENWCRPHNEVETLMELLIQAIGNETQELNENDVKIQAIGDLESLPQRCQEKIAEALELTANNKTLTINIALSYSARWEIVNAARKIAKKVAERELHPDQVDEELVDDHMETAGIPDPDLLIRTSGELRVSNFMLWQLAYTELYFTPVYWPDFRKKHFYQAVIDYQRRERRFGKVKAQPISTKNS